LENVDLDVLKQEKKVIYNLWVNMTFFIWLSPIPL